MTMIEWFLTELDSEAAKSRRVLEQGNLRIAHRQRSLANDATLVEGAD